MTDSTLLTAQQAAAILGMGRSFMTVHAAELGGIKVGSRLKFTRERIEAYKARQTVAEPPRAPSIPERRPVDIGKHRHATNPVTGKRWDDAPSRSSTRRA